MSIETKIFTRLKKGQTYLSMINNNQYTYVGRYMSNYEFEKLDSNGSTTTVIITYNTKTDLTLREVIETPCNHSMIVNRDTMDSMICTKGCGHEIK